MFGLTAEAESAQRQIDALNDAVEEEAKRQKELAQTLSELEAIRSKGTAAIKAQREAESSGATWGGGFGMVALGLEQQIAQIIKELEAIEVQAQLQIYLDEIERQLDQAAVAFSQAVGRELAGQISLLGTSSLSGGLRAVGGPIFGQAAGAAVDVVTGFADRDNSTLDQLTDSITDFFEGFKNIGAEAVEFIFDGLIKTGLPALVEGVIGLIPTLFAEIIATLGSPDFWIDVAKAFVDALLDAINPFNDIFGGGSRSATSADYVPYSPTQFGTATPGGARTTGGQTSQMSRTSEGLSFTIRPADFDNLQTTAAFRRIEVQSG
jgi:hypothetical protein